MPLSEEELDAVYDLPYTRAPHPSYRGEIPALKEVKFSLASCRGCFGGCSFCALTFHQGRVVQARSHASLIREAELMTHDREFKGYIHDVGGPTADFRFPACKKQLKYGVCADRQCLGYEPCSQMRADHSDYVELLEKLRHVKGVKKVFVRSGIRYDYVMYDKSDAFLNSLIKYHISGRLKVAPEHVSDRVLKLMGKPRHQLYDAFTARYAALNKKAGQEQFIVPYFMSSHPGSDLNAAIELALYLKKSGQRPEQVQDFYPTPGTLSTCMYYTGIDPRSGERRVCCAGCGGKGHAARAYAILYAQLCAPCQKGAEESPQGGPDRLFKGCAPAAERHTQARRKGRQKCRNGKAKIHKGKQAETDQSQKVPKAAIKRNIKPDMPA